MNRQENVKKFEELLSQVDREGMPQLLEYIRDKSDFYTAPASTRFHLSTEGGLLQHSLNVYECLQRKAQAERWQVKKDNAGAFIWESVPCYTVDDRVPYGHGEKSVMMIEQFMRLTDPERFAIRWHMGFSEPKELHLQLTQAMNKYPLILALHEADQEASTLLEDEKDNRAWLADEGRNQAGQGEGCDFQEAEAIGGAED